MDWWDLLAVHGTLKSLLQHHSSKASILWCSAFFIVQLSHPYMTTGKTIVLTRWTFVDKVMFLLFNRLSRLVITFLPRSKCLLISYLWLIHVEVWQKTNSVKQLQNSVKHFSFNRKLKKKIGSFQHEWNGIEFVLPNYVSLNQHSPWRYRIASTPQSGLWALQSCLKQFSWTCWLLFCLCSSVIVHVALGPHLLKLAQLNL